MSDDAATIFGLAVGWFLFLSLGVVAILALVWGVWYINLQTDTAAQGLRRTNINHQAESVIALNAYFHQQLSDIQTDREALAVDQATSNRYLKEHGSVDCNSVGGYNTCQQEDQYAQIAESDRTALIQAVNDYNQKMQDSDNVVGIDAGLPRHINSSGR